jgi:hypothetical protein
MGRPLVEDGTALDFVGLPLYPRMYIISDGRVFTSGTNAETKLLKTSAPGSWETVGSRKAGARLPRQPNRSASTPGHTVSSTPIALAMNSWWRPRLEPPTGVGHRACRVASGRGVVPLLDPAAARGPPRDPLAQRHPQQFPVFVRAGAVIAMLRSVPDTLCSPDFVNNTDIVCRDDDRTFSSTPRGFGFHPLRRHRRGVSRDR